MSQYQLISAAQMPVSQWAGGSTRQLAIYPVDATVAAQNFHWRFSSATVLQDGSFTAFPHHQRLLALRQGAGFVLQVDAHQQQLSAKQHLLRFAGSAVSSATLIAGAVVDINLMFDASLQANMWSQQLTADYLTWSGPPLAGATLLIYADEAAVEVCLQAGEAPVQLMQGDVLQVFLPKTIPKTMPTTMSKIMPKPMPKTMPMPSCLVRAAAAPCSAVFAWLAPIAGSPSV